jgi:integrase
MTDFPKVENAPGLKWRKLKNGWQAIWRARADLVREGYPLKSGKIWQGEALDAFTIAHIQEQCQQRQAEMLYWAGGGGTEGPAYVGTWRSLIVCYQTDPDSPFVSKEYRSRQHYVTLCRLIERDIGEERIDALDARRVLRLYEKWTNGRQKIAIGHALIGMLRGLLTYGRTFQKCPQCAELRVTLHDMRFKAAKAREVFLGADQVNAIRREAHKMERPYRHSIALAQALQFDVASGLRQKDVIGEWIPISEPGPLSDVISGNMRWVKGLRGEEIDENFILTHITSKRKKKLVADLKLSPMVMEEFRLMAGLSPTDELRRGHVPATGPLIVNEQTGLPYNVEAFRAAWRQVARAAGVPDEIRNMDSRSGAITEALAAGAPMEAVRKGATHSTAAMTSRYSRGDADAVVTVMQHRAAARKPKT